MNIKECQKELNKLELGSCTSSIFILEFTPTSYDIVVDGRFTKEEILKLAEIVKTYL